jgi:hypothetical protein
MTVAEDIVGIHRSDPPALMIARVHRPYATYLGNPTDE